MEVRRNANDVGDTCFAQMLNNTNVNNPSEAEVAFGSNPEIILGDADVSYPKS
jgi:hypothetical protein